MLVNQQHYRTIWPVFTDAEPQYVTIIDQTVLPHQFETIDIHNVNEMVSAIKTMKVRGAPLIGASAAYGIALAMKENTSDQALQFAAAQLLQSRPTAVNLAWAVDRMLRALKPLNPDLRLTFAWEEAADIANEDVGLNQQIGQHGLNIINAVIQKKHEALLTVEASETLTINVLTHCNAGWLATVDLGTALAPIYAAHDAGIKIHVWVDETRPRNQGASLTAWELGQHGVAHTVICDNAGGHLMQHGEVDMVIVGADRVTRAGDVCNKIGTYLKALAAYDNQVPFYVAVPSPTIDWSIENGLKEIPIELRHGDEVAWMQGKTAAGEVCSVRIVPEQSATLNPAFDVTPAKLVTGIITEKGVYQPNELYALMK
jgi:methylthioribose-1-phosphate isomerase